MNTESSELPSHPNKVIERAYLVGLSVTLELLRSIKTKPIQGLYNSCKKQFARARERYLKSRSKGKPDFSFITKCEGNIRNNFLAALWEKTSRYGNVESRRVRDPTETIETLNHLFNIAGAALRDFIVCWYPFPQPDSFGERVESDGRRYRIMGYQGRKTGPVTLGHPDIPALDLGDVLREPIRLLASFCYVHQVPLNDSVAYFRLFLIRSKPFLDYFYTERQCGLGGLREGVRGILNQLKRELAGFYNARNGEVPSVTMSRPLRRPKFSQKFFVSLLKEGARGLSEIERAEIEQLVSEGYLTSKDVEHVHRVAEHRAGKRGSRVHEHIRKSLPSPRNLRTAILNGDDINDDPEWLICTEVPLQTEQGLGRIDIVLLRRISRKDNRGPIYRPVMTVETKTRSSFSLRIASEWIETELGKKTWFSQSPPIGGTEEGMSVHFLDTEREVRYEDKAGRSDRTVARIVPKCIVGDRPLNQSQWSNATQSMPTKAAARQLEIYTNAVMEEFCAVSDHKNVSSPVKATLLLDTSERFSRIRPLLKATIIKTFELIMSRNKIPRTMFIPSTRDLAPKMALIVHAQDIPEDVRQEAAPCSWKPTYDPLSDAPTDGRRFILYLSERLDGSSGVSGAWIARYFNGLQFIYELTDGSSGMEVHWFDLLNEFSESPSIEIARTGSGRKRNAYRSRKIAKLTKSRLRSIHQSEAWQETLTPFLDSIKMHPLFEEIEETLFKGKDTSCLSEAMEIPFTGKPLVIIVSGWDTIRGATPSHYRKNLNRIFQTIVGKLPNETDTKVVWFDSPRQRADAAPSYRRRVVIPYYDTSQLRVIVNEIVWNLPVPQAKPPFYDDMRVLIHQTVHGFDIELIHVAPLMGWSKKFIGQSRGRVVRQTDSLERKTPRTLSRLRMRALALTLVPWLVDLWPKRIVGTLGKERFTARQALAWIRSKLEKTPSEITLAEVTLKAGTTPEPGILERIGYYHFGGRGARSHQPFALSSINDSRTYRSARRLKTRIPETSRRPPRECYLLTPKNIEVDADIVLKVESKRLRETVVILQRELHEWSTSGNTKSIRSLLDELEKVVFETDEELVVLKSISSTLSTNELTSETWRTLVNAREEIDFQQLSIDQQEYLRSGLLSYDDLWIYCGSHLVLMLIVLAVKHPDLNDDGVRFLWDVVRPWPMLQLGFEQRYPDGHKTGSSAISLETIWNDLKKKALTHASFTRFRRNNIRFGIELATKGSEYKWVVMESLGQEDRIDAGLFGIGAEAEDDEQFKWSVSRLDVVREAAANPENNQPIMKYLIRKSGLSSSEWEVWIWDRRRSRWMWEGFLEVVTRRAQSISGLRGFSILPRPSKGKPMPEEAFPETFEVEAIAKLANIKRSLENVRHVKLSLSMSGQTCYVQFKDSMSNEILGRLAITTSVDLLRLLRWPITEGRPLRLDTGQHVTWDPLEHEDSDIDYGGQRDLRPLVRSRKEDALDYTVPPILKDLPMKVQVVHDPDLCPMASGSGKKHEACWKLRVSGAWMGEVPEGGFDGGFTDKEVYEILGEKGTIGKMVQPEWFFVRGRSAHERIVFDTSHWMRELLAEKLGTRPGRVWKPEMYLAVMKRKWVSSFKASEEKLHWFLKPVPYVERTEPITGVTELDSSMAFDDMIDKTCEDISEHFPLESLANFKWIRKELSVILADVFGVKALGLSEEAVEHMREEVQLLGHVGKTRAELVIAPQNAAMSTQDFQLLVAFYMKHNQHQEALDFLDEIRDALRVVPHLSFDGRHKLIEVLVVKAENLLAIGKKEDARSTIDELLEIGENLSLHWPEAEETLKKAKRLVKRINRKTA
ncbi:MAG: hypothetical protein ACXAEN_04680 [Candidatus Thorarchaeota archaeon]|jgi:hypothetical protein